jgi:site-specific DNA-methyltransferase (adenine-specific)
MSDVKLWQGDCLELMKNIPDGSVDLVLTDPPYGTTQNKWDSIVPFDDMWRELHRITKPNSAIVLFSQMPFGAELIHSNIREFRYEWVWHKTMPTGFLNANRTPLRTHENILVFYRKLPTYNPQKWQGKPYNAKSGVTKTNNYGAYRTEHHTDCSDGKRYPVDVVKFNNGNNKERKHPTQKPVDLLEYLIRTYTNEGESVLDFTMGSGSTGVACVNTNRHFIGIELDKGYFDIAQQRINEAKTKEKVML